MAHVNQNDNSFIDNLIGANPEKSAELAKLGQWLLNQSDQVLQSLPISAVGLLVEYISDRIQEDRREQFCQEIRQKRNEDSSEDEFERCDRATPPMFVTEEGVTGLSSLWPTHIPVAEVSPPVLNIPRPERK